MFNIKVYVGICEYFLMLNMIFIFIDKILDWKSGWLELRYIYIYRNNVMCFKGWGRYVVFML